MNIYTIEEIKILAQIYEDNNPLIGITKEEAAQYGGAFSYVELMEKVIKECKLPGASLMEFLGAYEAVAYDESSRELLRKFLFEEPLIDMPLHINDSDADRWKSHVASWRLKINK